MNEKRIEELVRELLTAVGEDPSREGLQNTPGRVARAYGLLLSGYKSNPEEIVGNTKFAAETNDMVILRDIEVYSLCEHHMLPFYGKCHIGYIPQGSVIGVSKLARVVDAYARRLQIQERLTSQIAHAVLSAVDAKGVGVVLECRHLCMMMRGVEKQNSVMTTSSVLGAFRDSEATRLEFLSLIKQGS
jgi:GTP cyclohydrolase I